MKRAWTSGRFRKSSNAATMMREVWPPIAARSDAFIIRRISPDSSLSTANGAPDQPTSIWPLSVCVSVAGPPPVAVGLRSTPNCFFASSTIICEDEPALE